MVTASTDDLLRARSALAEAELAERPSDRYMAAHLTALRVVAIVLTHRSRRDTRPQNVSKQIARRPADAIRNTNPGVGEGMKL